MWTFSPYIYCVIAHFNSSDVHNNDDKNLQIGDTYFGSTGDRRKRLVPVIHAMMLMYNRAIIVGRSPEDQPRVEKVSFCGYNSFTFNGMNIWIGNR